MTTDTLSAKAFAEALQSGGLVDPVTGIINGIRERPRQGEYADLFNFGALTCDTGQLGGPDNFRGSGGSSLNRASAWLKAMGEGVERYCSAIYDPLDYPLMMAKKAPFQVVDPNLYALYDDALSLDPNFPFESMTVESQLRWCEVTAFDGKTVHIPAASVYLPWYYEINNGETPLFQPISTGLACHSTLDNALLGGLMEVVERDAFTILWQSRSSLLEIDLSGLNAYASEIIRRIYATGATLRVGFIETDHGIPVCVAIQYFDDPALPAMAVAASAAPNPMEAVTKALEEVVHTFRWVSTLKRITEIFEPGENFEGIETQNDHLLYWSDQENIHQSEFLWQGRVTTLDAIPRLVGSSSKASLDEAVARIEGVGYTPLFKELTTSDIAEFNLHVARVIIPGFNPLFMGHSYRSRINPRLLARLKAMEAADPDGFQGANVLPHPFP